jgi:hypothetical protein
MLKNEFPKLILKDSWVMAHKAIGMLLKLFTIMGTLLSRWLIRSALDYSIGLNHSIGTSNS